MTVRQLGAVVVALFATVAFVLVDRQSTDVFGPDSSKLLQSSIIESTTMPYISESQRLTTNWFCPGVPANDDTISSNLVIANPSDVDISATVTLLSNDQPPVLSTVVVAARTSSVVDARGGITSPFVSAVVEILGPIGSVEQVINHPAGDSVAACATKPSGDWYFADGFTGADSVEQIVLTNPYSDATVVDITFVTADSERQPQNLQGFVLSAQSVTTLSMDEQGARNEPILAVSIHASSGRLIAGRSQHYLGQGRLGYASSLGAPAMSTQWWFADGEKTAGNTENLVIFNPSEIDRSLSIVFVNGSDPQNSIEPALITAPAHRVVVVDTGTMPTLPVGRYGIVVSTNDQVVDQKLGIVVEQVINRRDGNTVGTSVVFGAPRGAQSTRWSSPSGLSTVDDAIQIFNTTADEGTVSVSQVGPAGAVAITGMESLVLPPGAVLSIGIPLGLPTAQMIVESTTQVIVQRLFSRGHELFGRAAVLAIPHLPSPNTPRVAP